jgi:hypothetical protein
MVYLYIHRQSSGSCVIIVSREGIKKDGRGFLAGADEPDTSVVKRQFGRGQLS